MKAMKKTALRLPTRKLMSLNHVLMDLANQIEIPAQLTLNADRTDREFMITPNNLVAFRMDVTNVYQGEKGLIKVYNNCLVDIESGFADVDLILNLEWIDDRFRLRNHPNESLAQLDNIFLTDFRSFHPSKIWTPEISIINRIRASVHEVFTTYSNPRDLLVFTSGFDSRCQDRLRARCRDLASSVKNKSVHKL